MSWAPAPTICSAVTAGWRLRNLEIAFGRETGHGLARRVARAHFKSLGGNLLCSLKLPLMRKEDVLKRVTPEGMEHQAPCAGARASR